MNKRVNQQTHISSGLQASEPAVAVLKERPSPQSIASADPQAIKNKRLDRKAWTAKATAMGKFSRAQTAADLQTLFAPSILPAVRREVHTAISQYQKEPADLMALICQDVTLATAVTAGCHFQSFSQRSAALAKPSAVAPRNVFADAIARIKLQSICNALDNAEMDAAPMTKLIEPWLHAWWRHAIAVSQLSGELANGYGVATELARMAGFFHDIGRLMLLSSKAGPKLITTYEATPLMDIPTVFAEHALLGMDHHQAGAAYCTRWKLPLAIHDICGQHDLDDTMRQQFGGQSPRLSAVVTAANEIAKAIGIGSLPDDEIRPLPQCMHPVTIARNSQLQQSIAQIQTLCHWRTGHCGIAPLPVNARLDGKLVAYVSPTAGPWSTCARLLMRAGATVKIFTNIKQVTLNCPLSDLMLIDLTDSSLHLAMAMLIRLSRATCFAHIPKLLLANADENPQSRVQQAGLSMTAIQTPIRCLAILQKARELMA